jgi:hypothetical protein
MKRIRNLIGGVARVSQSAIETDFVVNCLKNQEVLMNVAEELLKRQAMQSVTLARLERGLNRLRSDIERLEKTISERTVEPHSP